MLTPSFVTDEALLAYLKNRVEQIQPQPGDSVELIRQAEDLLARLRAVLDTGATTLPEAGSPAPAELPLADDLFRDPLAENEAAHLRQANEILRQENERLRQRLAGGYARETAVFEQVEQFCTLAEHSLDLIIRLDRDLHHLYVNPAVERMTGIAKETFLQSVFDELPVYGQGEDLSAALKALFDSGQKVNTEIPLQTVIGKRWFNISAIPEATSDGKIESLLVVARDITEYKMTEHALRRSEERLRAATNRANFIVFEQDRDLYYTWIHNPRVPAPVNSVLGQRDEDIFSSADAARLIALKKHVLETGQGSRLELDLYYEGAHRWYDTIIEPRLDSQGNITGILGSLLDISELKRKEANERFIGELGKTLQTLLLPDEVCEEIASRLGQYLRLDRCLVALIEDGNSVILKDYHPGLESLADIKPHTGLATTISTLLDQGEMFVVEDTATNPLTQAFDLQVLKPHNISALIAVPFYGQGKRSGSLLAASSHPRVWREDEIQLLNAVSDLARLAIENARLVADLLNAQQRFQTALSNTQIAVYTLDRDLRFTWVFNGMVDDPSTIIGRRYNDFFAEDVASEVGVLFHEALEKEETRRKELTFNWAGSDYHIDITVDPLYDAEEQIVGLSVATMNITHLRQMEAEKVRNLTHIELQGKLIQERESERTRIARELHDGPLQELIATNFYLVEAMEINEKEPRLEKMRYIQETLVRQVQELRRFCNDLRPPALGPFGLEKTIRSHAETFLAHNSGITIHLDLQPDARRLPEDLRLTLFRVYQELLNNVVRHAKASEVLVQFRYQPDEATLLVADNGIGFTLPANWLDLARQGHLGLVGISERVELIGGKAMIDSQPGQGTRVTVSVPLGAPDGASIHG